MTLDEIKVLIDELVWAAKESQAYIDDQFVATDEEGAELFKKRENHKINFGKPSSNMVVSQLQRCLQWVSGIIA